MRRIAYSLHQSTAEIVLAAAVETAEIVVAVAVETAAAFVAVEIVVAASSVLSNYYPHLHPHFPHYRAHQVAYTNDRLIWTRCLFLCLLNFWS